MRRRYLRRLDHVAGGHRRQRHRLPARQRPRVTVAVNSFEFHQPVFVGDLISCYAEVTRVGRTALTVTAEVHAERERREEECIEVTQATLTYTALGDERRLHPAPPEN